MTEDLIAELRAWQERCDALPPIPHVIFASHSVPFGRYFKMWDTKGRLLVYVNRGWVADLKRVEADPTPWTPGMSILPLTGVRVVFE